MSVCVSGSVYVCKYECIYVYTYTVYTVVQKFNHIAGKDKLLITWR